MELKTLQQDVEVIRQLGDQPNLNDGLDANALKAKFDEGPKILKEYINGQVVPAVNEKLPASQLGAAITAALAEAKESGAFDGEDAYTILLTRSAAVIPVGSDGYGYDQAALEAATSTEVVVFKGAEDITDQCSFSWETSDSANVGLSAYKSKAAYVSKMTGTDHAIATVTVSLDGEVIGTKMFSVAKARKGETGVGIADIQVGTNAESGDIEITIAATDGKCTVFSIPSGANGADGKSVIYCDYAAAGQTVTDQAHFSQKPKYGDLVVCPDGSLCKVTSAVSPTRTVLSAALCNIKGEDGKTPLKGVDYYTEADKTEMVAAVLAALPTWDGGMY